MTDEPPHSLQLQLAPERGGARSLPLAKPFVKFSQHENFLQALLHVLSHSSQSATFPNFDDTKVAVADSTAPVTGAQLLHRLGGSSGIEHQHGPNNSRAIKLIDLVRVEGAGRLVEVVGTRQSGRSALVLEATLSFLLANPRARAAFLHTFPAFEPLAFRAREVLTNKVAKAVSAGVHFDRDGQQLDDDDVAISVLERLSVTRPFTSDQAIESIEAEIEQSKSGDDDLKLSIVIVDSLETLLGGQTLKDSSAKGHADMVAFMTRLDALAKDIKLPLTVFLVNTAHSTTPASVGALPTTQFQLRQPVKPALGATFTYLTDLTIWTMRADKIAFKTPHSTDAIKADEDVFIAEVVKDKRGPTGRWIAFKLVNGVQVEELA
ncbi:hypothetical protein ACM66B_002617 [Microbotryomycetes sp. NB124-2]